MNERATKISCSQNIIVFKTLLIKWIDKEDKNILYGAYHSGHTNVTIEKNYIQFWQFHHMIQTPNGKGFS